MFVLFVIHLKHPSLAKRGRGDFMENRFMQKIPLNPPLLKGEGIQKNFGCDGMTDRHIAALLI
jgi:hypothetical protein